MHSPVRQQMTLTVWSPLRVECNSWVSIVHPSGRSFRARSLWGTSHTASMRGRSRRERRQRRWWILAVGRACNSWLRNVSKTPLRPSCRVCAQHPHLGASSHLQPPSCVSSLAWKPPRCCCIPLVRGFRACAAGRRSCRRPFARRNTRVSRVLFLPAIPPSARGLRKTRWALVLSPRRRTCEAPWRVQSDDVGCACPSRTDSWTQTGASTSISRQRSRYWIQDLDEGSRSSGKGEPRSPGKP